MPSECVEQDNGNLNIVDYFAGYIGIYSHIIISLFSDISIYVASFYKIFDYLLTNAHNMCYNWSNSIVPIISL